MACGNRLPQIPRHITGVSGRPRLDTVLRLNASSARRIFTDFIPAVTDLLIFFGRIRPSLLSHLKKDVVCVVMF